MKNKVELKKVIIINSVIVIIGLVVLFLINLYEYRCYNLNYNMKIEEILSQVKKEYKDVEEVELIKILSSDNTHNYDILKSYGINIMEESALIQNDKCFIAFTCISFGTIIVIILLLVIIFLIYNYKKDKKIREIVGYIEQINMKNYKLDIEDNTEDELSILKNEIYKTTVMLKEQAENSKSDKNKMKVFLSDISHQLKTPLTSIIILLDNILEDPNMDKSTKTEFIKDIRKEVININFLVQALLKFSKFDVNAVEYLKKENKICDIIKEAINRLSVLSDLKNVDISVER